MLLDGEVLQVIAEMKDALEEGGQREDIEGQTGKAELPSPKLFCSPPTELGPRGVKNQEGGVPIIEFPPLSR